MKNIGDNISTKTYDELRNEGIISEDSKIGDTYVVRNNMNWFISVNNDPCVGIINSPIITVDISDPKVPYFVDNVWIPEFMIKESSQEQPSTESSDSVTETHVKYGKLFKKYIEIEHAVIGPDSNLIYNLNKNALKYFTLEECKTLARILKLYDSSFLNGQSSNNFTRDQLRAEINKYAAEKFV